MQPGRTHHWLQNPVPVGDYVVQVVLGNDFGLLLVGNGGMDPYTSPNRDPTPTKIKKQVHIIS